MKKLHTQHSGRFSVIPARAFDDTCLTHRVLVTLGVICTYSDKDGWCWPSRKAIAQRMGIAVSTVSGHIKRLEELGYLEVVSSYHRSGAQTTNKYRVLFDPILSPERRRYAEEEEGGESEIRGGSGPEPTGGSGPEPTGGSGPEPTGGSGPEPTQNVPSERPIKRPRRTDVAALTKNANGATPETSNLPACEPITTISRTVGDTPPPLVAPPPSPNDRMIWRLVCTEMEAVMSPTQRREWLDRLELLSAGPDDYAVLAPTPYAAQHVEQRWGGHFRAALRHATGHHEVKVEFLSLGVPA